MRSIGYKALRLSTFQRQCKTLRFIVKTSWLKLTAYFPLQTTRRTNPPSTNPTPSLEPQAKLRKVVLVVTLLWRQEGFLLSRMGKDDKYCKETT